MKYWQNHPKTTQQDNFKLASIKSKQVNAMEEYNKENIKTWQKPSDDIFFIDWKDKNHTAKDDNDINIGCII